MKSQALIAAFDLPESSLVNQRVPRKLLLENGAPTSADKRSINEGIEELIWIAALKPVTVGVPEFRDESHEYLEIAVLLLTLRDGAKTTRLVELVHRAIPYPVLLLTQQGAPLSLSVAHKRWSQSEAGKTVLEGDIVSVAWSREVDADIMADFRNSLALGSQPRTNLHALYQGWLDSMVALNAARVTGNFTLAENAEYAAARRDALRECGVLQEEIGRLRTLAAKERQIPRQVELNLELKRIDAELATTKQKL
ncbi:DUF4391 domain-containing protein [Pelodictyon phaeoclathratiforme]|jgi:hypothetical protein|uniref:DUF4391 domain-containing protein n=1 Tax=Pelodictyon phaeoclathratiforme (strain DSM 5477 / BU-1) TaxID=324925 RepID=B4SG95_PELPB|nr:DUF4391 domain-containing protein [Pelodictyon phaeoclathratiforme]ACF43406.1 conserved hypothetical protein [Pelodictyon phaeoclathratiforme BU-1]MBV5289349.1 DUF4391 domain-containing protein [Pelodictyon phaeoclathratiforme]